jgi:hypothetical protein
MTDAPSPASPGGEPGEHTAKEQILGLYLSGIHDVEDLAMLTASRPSYVGSVLQEEGLGEGYFDLYTSTAHPMNVYSKFFAGKLGFKDVETARAGVALVDRLYRQFALARDRAGQHHALLMALTMFDRARWTGKTDEAEVYRQWLADHLASAAP